MVENNTCKGCKHITSEKTHGFNREDDSPLTVP